MVFLFNLVFSTRAYKEFLRCMVMFLSSGESPPQCLQLNCPGIHPLPSLPFPFRFIPVPFRFVSDETNCSRLASFHFRAVDGFVTLWHSEWVFRFGRWLRGLRGGWHFRAYCQPTSQCAFSHTHLHTYVLA